MHWAPSTSTYLHPPPPSSFQPPLNSLQHPQQYSNQNVARNWAISPNLGQKIQSVSLWLKIGTHGILEVLTPNPDLDFWNPDPKIHFLAKFVPKKSKLFVLPENWHTWYPKDDDSYSNISFLNLQPKIHFWANLVQKSKSCPICLTVGTHCILRILILILTLVFWNSKPKSFVR